MGYMHFGADGNPGHDPLMVQTPKEVGALARLAASRCCRRTGARAFMLSR